MTRAVMLILVAVSLGAVIPTPAASQTIGPVFFVINRGGTTDCYEMFVEISPGSSNVSMKGRVVLFGGVAADGAVVGSGYLDTGPAASSSPDHEGGSIASFVWGLEAFPTVGLAVAAKIGGILLLSTRTGNGAGFHLTPANFFFFLFTVAVLATSCPAPS